MSPRRRKDRKARLPEPCPAREPYHHSPYVPLGSNRIRAIRGWIACQLPAGHEGPHVGTDPASGGPRAFQ